MSTIDESYSESYSDGLERSFLNISSHLAEPFCWAYGLMMYQIAAPLDPNKFENASSKVQEISKRVFVLLGATLALVGAGLYIGLATAIVGATCKLFRAVGVAIQKNQYTHIQGLCPEKILEQGQASVMTWDLCGHSGGLHYAERGVVHWRSRIDQIIEKIKTEDPDVIVLQEIYDTALSEALIEKLQSNYAHFFTHLGINTWGAPGGCMVISKCAVHSFSHTDFNNNGWLVNRGFEKIELKAHPTDELPCLRIIGTHISEKKQEESAEQVEQIIKSLKKERLVLPTLFVGNVNEQEETLSKYLFHSYRGKTPTHTDQLANQWTQNLEKTDKMSDLVSLFKRRNFDGDSLPVTEKVRLLSSHLVPAYDETFNTQTALSAHHGILTKFDGLKPLKQ